MRMLVRFTMPVEAGNDFIKSGRLAQFMESYLGELKPEAAYFFTQEGERGGILVFDMSDTSQMPAIAEPLFLAFNASVEFAPVMSAEDLAKGAPGLEAAVKKYG